MARTVLTSQTTNRSGLTVSYTAGDAANGHEFNNDGETKIVHVKNGGVGTLTITIPTPGTVDGLAIADRTVTVGAGVEMFIGPFKNSRYGNNGASAGSGLVDVYLDLDVDASVTLAVIKAGNP